MESLAPPQRPPRVSSSKRSILPDLGKLRPRADEVHQLACSKIDVGSDLARRPDAVEDLDCSLEVIESAIEKLFGVQVVHHDSDLCRFVVKLTLNA